MKRAGGTFILIYKKKIKIHSNEWARLHLIHNLWELKLFSCWFWLGKPNEFFYFILKNVSKNDTTYMRIL